MENPITKDDLGLPSFFRKPPYIGCLVPTDPQWSPMLIVKPSVQCVSMVGFTWKIKKKTNNPPIPGFCGHAWVSSWYHSWFFQPAATRSVRSVWSWKTRWTHCWRLRRTDGFVHSAQIQMGREVIFVRSDQRNMYVYIYIHIFKPRIRVSLMTEWRW